MDHKAKLKDLISQKDKIEQEIKQLHEVLSSHGNAGMNEPLVDSEGYPRNDIDVYQIRISRNKIACLQNDHKSLMEDIEQELYTLHSATRGDSMDVEASAPTIDVSIADVMQPFATINLVSTGSPAESAGLHVGDEVLQFGSVNKSNFTNLQMIGAIVQHSEGKTIEVKIRRDAKDTRLMLIPKKWSGRGLLGCNIVPLT